MYINYGIENLLVKAKSRLIGKRILDAEPLSRRHHRISASICITICRSASLVDLLLDCVLACAFAREFSGRSILLRARHTVALLSPETHGQVQKGRRESQGRRKDKAKEGNR